jgi:hypothetical protein
MKRIFVLSVVLFLVRVTFGQNSATINEVFSGKEERSSFVPAGNPAVSNAISSFRLVTSTDGTLAAVNLGFGIIDRISGNIEVASPLSQDGITRPASLDGLASDGRVTLGLKYKGWRALSQDEIINALKKYGVNSFMDLSDEDKSKILNEINLPSPWFIGATGSVNKQSFSYAQDNTLTTFVDEDKHSVSGSAFAGIYVGKSLNSLFRAVWLYKNNFSANESNEYLIPFNGGPTLIRKDIIIGSPANKQSHQFQIENVTRFLGSNFGINPSITYLSDVEDFVFDLPVYIIPQYKEEKLLDLNGGVFLNVTTGPGTPFTSGIFIGSSLSTVLGL